VPRRLGGGKGESRRDRDVEDLVRDLKKSEPALQRRSRSREAIKQEIKRPEQPVDSAPVAVK